jgi:GDP-D-mannose 3',5'-epimerase
VSINELADLIMKAAGVKLEKKHVSGALGVRGRNSDNTLVKKVLGWEPKVTLEEGLARTYAWIEGQVKAKLDAGKAIDG